MFKIIGNDVYFNNVLAFTFNPKLLSSFRENIEQALKHNFYTIAEMNELKALISRKSKEDEV